MTRLADKVAIVTGGTSGIGLAIAKRFAAEGAAVVITGRRDAQLQDALGEIGHDALGVQADMSNLADVDRLYSEVRKRHGRIDVLVANAGLGEFRALADITVDHYEHTFATNVKGTLFTVQRALDQLVDGAAIMLIGSTAGSSGTPAFSVYGATKAAIRSFARSWMIDLKDRHIRVNVLSPGPIETPGLHGLSSNDDEAAQSRAFMESMVPLARLGQPAEVANAALFLCSDEASFVNGVELFVDGGTNQY
jgi:NAD(P)-dependent dehydrogenase (short-subunit alcohol dehydrogenase family)